MSIWSADNLFKLGAGLYSVKQQYDAGRDAEKAGRRNAARLEAETEETKRRTRREQRKRQSSLRARAAASGIKLSGSTKTFLDDYVEEDERQLSWLEESGKSQASILRKQGKEERRNAQYGSYGTFLRTAGSWLGS
jgi:hypothetical protein